MRSSIIHATRASGPPRRLNLRKALRATLGGCRGCELRSIASLMKRGKLRARNAVLGTPSVSSTAHDERDHRVSVEDVDDYLRGIDEPKRSTLEALRRTIVEIIPEAEQIISYRVPAFRVEGRIVAGFAAFKDHLSYLPFSGSVLAQLTSELDGYTMTKSALHFPIDRPLPKSLVRKLIAARLES